MQYAASGYVALFTSLTKRGQLQNAASAPSVLGKVRSRISALFAWGRAGWTGGKTIQLANSVSRLCYNVYPNLCPPVRHVRKNSKTTTVTQRLHIETSKYQGTFV